MEVPIPSDWDGVSFCRYAVCWPDSEEWKAVLYGLVEMPNQGRFWDFHTGNFLLLRNQFREAYDYNFNLKEVIMACGDTGLADIAIAINNVAGAMNAQASASAYSSAQCCDRRGSQGAGTSAPPFNPTTPGVPNVDPPPDGFETWEEFLSDKCAIAWSIVETLQSDLGQLAITNLGNITATTLATILAVTLSTPIPFDDMVALAAFLLAIAAEIVIATALSILNDNLGQLACELYQGDNSNDSRNRFLSTYGDLVDAANVDAVEGFAIKTLVGYMLTSAATNRLYVKDTSVSYPARDCSGCAECFENTWDDWTIITGTNAVIDGGMITLDSELVTPPGYHYVDLELTGAFGIVSNVTFNIGGVPATNFRVQVNVYDADGHYPAEADQGFAVVVESPGQVSIDFTTASVIEQVLFDIRRESAAQTPFTGFEISNLCITSAPA